MRVRERGYPARVQLGSVASTLRRLGGGLVPRSVKLRLRPLAVRAGLAVPVPWWHVELGGSIGRRTARGEAVCNICGWAGDVFLGGHHVESATCPQCGSVARDRFLLWCAARRGALKGSPRVLETSPRMGDDYRKMMRRQLDYRASDFDLGSHIADIHLDLQAIDLPDQSLDVVLTPHVLEHVPHTQQALTELHRVMAPGGRVYLQVPLLHGVTAAPPAPEFHADNTPVFWNFGWDLTDSLRSAGFVTTVLVTDQFSRVLRGVELTPAPDGDIFDVADMVRHARPADLTVIADDRQAGRMGWLPSHQFVTWECRRPG